MTSYGGALASLESGLRVLREPLQPGSPLWAWATEAIGERSETMLSHLEGVRLGEDIEAVHDMRVGSRRLVAAMRVFESCFPDDRFRSLLREARRVTRLLGGVRDLDVLIDHYARLREHVEPAELPGVDYFIAHWRREREVARRPMLEALEALEASAYPERVREHLRREAETYAVGLGPVGRRCAPCHGPFRAAAPGFIRQRHAELYAFEPYVHHPEAETELHDMRIAAKWLRYTMELFAPAYAGRLKGPLGVVKEFQELLGDLHDSDVRREMLRTLLVAPLEEDSLSAAGIQKPEQARVGLALLLQREETVREQCYRAFYKEWKKQAERGFAEKCLRQVGEPDA